MFGEIVLLSSDSELVKDITYALKVSSVVVHSAATVLEAKKQIVQYNPRIIVTSLNIDGEPAAGTRLAGELQADRICSSIARVVLFNPLKESIEHADLFDAVCSMPILFPSFSHDLEKALAHSLQRAHLNDSRVVIDPENEAKLQTLEIIQKKVSDTLRSELEMLSVDEVRKRILEVTERLCSTPLVK